jgi:hypothetical protein
MTFQIKRISFRLNVTVIHSSPMLLCRSIAESACGRRNVHVTSRICITEVAAEVKLRPTVSRSVRFGVSHPSGTCDQYFFLLEILFRQLRDCVS